MRVYFYDRESGVYQGEGYETNPAVLNEEGVTVVAPPPYEKGSVPVFEPCDGHWTLKRIDAEGGIINYTQTWRPTSRVMRCRGEEASDERV